MNNQPQTNVLDTPVSNIGVETLRPTPFRRVVKSLRKVSSIVLFGSDLRHFAALSNRSQ